MNKILIRKAEINDMVSVLDLIKELAEFEREPKSVSINVNDLINDGFCDNPKFRCLVAETKKKGSWDGTLLWKIFNLER